MMMRSSAMISLAVAMAGVTACGDGSSESAPLSLQGGPFGASTAALTASEAEARATEIVPGTVISSDEDSRRGREVFEVYVLTSEGAVVSIYVVAGTGEILEVEQQSEGPAPNLQPVDGYITLQEAIDIALQAQSGTVIRWELEPDDDSVWQYELYVRASDGQIYEVEIDAQSGALLELELESEADHDDWEDHPIRDGSTAAPRDEVEAAALGFVDGRLDSMEIDTEDGYRVWSVDVERTTGGEVELDLLDPSLALLSAEGTEGPFDYDFDPGPAYISLSEARAAVPNVDNLELEEWSLEREDGRLVYTLEYDDEDLEFEVDATTGDLLP